MYKMIIELDEARMKKEEFCVKNAWDAIGYMAKEANDIDQIEKGIFITEDFGAQLWFLDLLETKDWFLDYVTVWKVENGLIKEDIIESRKEL